MLELKQTVAPYEYAITGIFLCSFLITHRHGMWEDLDDKKCLYSSQIPQNIIATALFTLRKPRSPLIINGERDFLGVN